ncbi:hypothetical protein ABER23_17330 [Paenibacillus lautus]|uniref:hypothetical protein n=1 Tax=Paenibacillus lautus TaxID=1401 RepID=UPI003D267686
MDDVYVVAGDSAKGVGSPINKYLNQINKDAIESSFAFTANNRYHFCIPTGAGTYPNMCLVYSYEYRQWLPYSADLLGVIVVFPSVAWLIQRTLGARRTR